VAGIFRSLRGTPDFIGRWSMVRPAGAASLAACSISQYFRQGAASFRFYLGALDLAAIPLRSTHAAGMGFLFRNRPRKHLHYAFILAYFPV